MVDMDDTFPYLTRKNCRELMAMADGMINISWAAQVRLNLPADQPGEFYKGMAAGIAYFTQLLVLSQSKDEMVAAVSTALTVVAERLLQATEGEPDDVIPPGFSEAVMVAMPADFKGGAAPRRKH